MLDQTSVPPFSQSIYIMKRQPRIVSCGGRSSTLTATEYGGCHVSLRFRDQPAARCGGSVSISILVFGNFGYPNITCDDLSAAPSRFVCPVVFQRGWRRRFSVVHPSPLLSASSYLSLLPTRRVPSQRHQDRKSVV